MQPSSGVRALLALVVLVALVRPGSATVTQVDGTVLPVPNGTNECDGAGGDNLQVCFNTLEGTSPPAPDAIHQTLDAAITPEIFLPNTRQAVVFRDISEGAGFENSFGWYNIGDDVATAAGRAANLHPILGCGRPMNATGGPQTHAGNPAFYIQNAEPGAQVSVDFAAERTAGRYKGGFIGFYLITPESNPSSDNCGDFKNGSDNQSLFSFIYFTQKDLNNDGDFVHHLVYGSKRTANRFYFGFEDLFRGGDNDFEDMLIQVTGLTPPCVPQAEVCDGIDNDCDGEIDADDGDLTGVNDVCTCDGSSMTCDNGPVAGQCQAGVTVCTAGEVVCHATGQPTSEVCDNLDNNCNGIVDDNPSGTGAACDGTDADTCPEGQIVCRTGALVCNDATANNTELCNGVDDDCDGTIDEGNPGGGGSCGSSIGVCSPGTFVCQNGGLVCQGGNTGGAEQCNNLDDDCDGVVDDSPGGVGMPCGASDVGQCELGQTICTNGTLSCAGEVGASPERCNTDDDDCDGQSDEQPVDAGQPCGSSIGACEPGELACDMSGQLVCVGGVGPSAEDCNGIDDDCDGKVDEQVPGEGVACGGGSGPCSGGMTKCIAGQMQCVGGTSGGTETCNLIDDDCDGTIDEGDLCGGGVCDNGVCASRCLEGEFPCPNGKKCVDDFCVDDPCFNVQCPADASGNAQTCVEGGCVLLCSTVTCPGDLVCRNTDGACVRDTCEYLPKCGENELCVNSACVPNRCVGVECADGEFCRDGGCVKSCQGVTCGATQTCRDGECVATGCDVDCGDGVCNPETGQCQDDRCEFVQCGPTQACDPLTGMCIADPCQGVTCPDGQACSAGQCGVGSSGQLVTTGGGGGCSTSGGDGSLAGLALVIAGLLLRRRRAALLAVTLAASAAGGCNVNEYCLECEVDDGGGSGSGSGGGDGGMGSGDGGGTTCDPNQIHPETCNNADDDCDGLVDETTDLQGDELNCGACGVQCNKPGAQTLCGAGACEITGCFPGFLDRNGDTTGPYAASDGCEYTCFTSNNGVEACDALDNDCDGVTDEGFDKTTDENNCGACGTVCEFFQADAHCAASQCVFDPAVDCAPGYHDANGTQADGCEYECAPTNNGVEACDVVDNDCDGMVDETFDFSTDPDNCGRCGLSCEFANATASCTAGQCGFDPASDCVPGYVDADGNQVDGCEYACVPNNMGAERCDGVDNDCNGTADDNPNDTGGACASTGTPRGACVANGVRTCSAGGLVCSGATQPTAETCDNVDNDCDGMTDDAVARACYTGPASTNGIGVCRAGTETCSAGRYGACTGQVTPSAEQCNNLDDNCDGTVDNAPGGGPIVASCYGGPAGTAGVGTCTAGTRTCAFGSLGSCSGEVQPTADRCGDNLDTDCDTRSDAAEGCLMSDAEQRIDEATANANHSHDVVLARGNGTNIYAVWSQRVGSTTEVYLRKSTDGGVTWGDIVNVTSSVSQSAVKPRIAVAPGATDRVIVAFQTISAGVRDIRVSRSTDGGASFSNAVGPLDAAGDSFNHAVAISGTTVVVTWEKLDTGTLIRDVQSAVSTNGGAAFGAEFRVNVGSPATRFAGRPQVAITSSGGVVWVWREQRAGATRDIFAAASATAVAPTADVRLDGDAGQTRESDFPVLASAGANVYVAWQDVSTASGGGADVMFARSLNGGAAWSTERIIDDPTGEVSSSFTPAIAVDPRTAAATDDLVAIAWEDRREGAQIYAAVSGDAGATFAAPTRASSDAGAVAAGRSNAPVIAAPGGGVLVIAYQNQMTNQNVHVFASTSIDAGATWHLQQDQLDAGGGNALAPAIAPTLIGTEPGAVVGWADFRGNQVNGDIYVAVAH